MGVALKGISILIVEDDTDTRDLLRVLLESDGGLVVTAASVKEALSAYDRRRPDVIVADIVMPEYNGYTLIGWIRARSSEHGSIIADIPLIAYATSIDHDTVLYA